MAARTRRWPAQWSQRKTSRAKTDLHAEAIVEACGRALSETALESLQVSPDLLARMNGSTSRSRPAWRELWPDAPAPEGGR